MIRFDRFLLASVSLAVACSSNNQQSQNPEAGNYDGYHNENGSGDPGTQPSQAESGTAKPATMTGSVAKPRRSGKHISLVAKRPPVRGAKPRPTPGKTVTRGGDKIVIAGVAPTAVAPGSVIEVFGEGLDRKGIAVQVGQVPQKIKSAEPDRLVVEYTGGKGPLAIAASAPRKGSRVSPTLARSQISIDALAKDDPFGSQARTDAAQGLIGTVYDIKSEVSELPSFGELGDPIAVIAVDNLDIGATEFKGKLGGKGNWFGIHFKGSLNVLEAGDYQLCVDASAGAQLYLDEGLIIDNDGRHEMKEVCETVYIEPGEYGLDLLFMQDDTPDMGLTLSWSKDGGQKAPIPAANLFPPDVSAFARP